MSAKFQTTNANTVEQFDSLEHHLNLPFFSFVAIVSEETNHA